MKKDLAESFSLSFHPLFLPFYIMLFIFVLPIFQVQSIGSTLQLYILIIVAMATVILPMASMYYFKRKGIISSYEMPKMAERNTPYIYTIIHYGITAYLFYSIDILPIIIPLLLAIPALVITLLLIINLKLKVSAHAAGMGSLNAIIFVLMQTYLLDLMIPLLVSILLSLIVILSRKYLKAHSWSEIIIGYVIGAGVTLGLGVGIL
ncbi:MAG: hypothetical protein KAG84_06105 [Bacteroidales bacterium]|nr:hypothetical protein [Bacteroidales bacterium]